MNTCMYNRSCLLLFYVKINIHIRILNVESTSCVLNRQSKYRTHGLCSFNILKFTFRSPARNNSTSKSLHKLKSPNKSSSLLLLDEAILDLVELSQRTLTKSFKYFKSFLFTQPWWIRYDSVSVFMSRYSNYMSYVNAFTVQIRDTSRANSMVGVSHRQFSIFTDVWHHCRDSVSVQWCVVVPNRFCFRHSNFRPLP